MWLLLINPTSGGRKGSVVGSQVANYLERSGITFKDISGSSFESAATNLRESLSGDVDRVVMVGGDGLAHLAIQVLAGTKIPLLVIPAGTGNDFARALKLPLDKPELIIERSMQSSAVDIDLGRVNGRWFAAVLSTGFDSLVNERANRSRFLKGRIKYNVAILMELPFFKARHYRFTIDGVALESRAMLIAIANGESYGGGMRICPEAKFDDGLLDIMILGPISKLEFLRVFPKVFSGSHITHPAVKILQGREVSIEADAIAYADGERISPLPVHAKAVAGALRTWRM